jgi:DnaJ-class molecular chaperone
MLESKTMATKVKFYVTTVSECPACGGVGGPGAKPCTDCGGTGTLEDAVELTTALASLGILTRLEQVERTAGRAAYYSDAMANGGI